MAKAIPAPAVTGAEAELDQEALFGPVTKSTQVVHLARAPVSERIA
jgi:hypothetical protein